MRRVLPFMFLILFTLACMTVDILAPAPTNTPAIIPYSGQTAQPTPMETFAPLPAISTPQVYPQWVTEFSDPVLKALKNQQPDFQDDFPAICIDEDHKWKVCSEPEQRPSYYQPNYMSPDEWRAWSQSQPVPTLLISELALATARPTLDLQPDLQKGYALLNKGWFYIVPDSARNPHYAHIDNGALVLSLPEGKENKDIMVYSPHLRYENFVLQFDFEFKESQPGDTLRFQFNQSADQSIALDLSKNKTWAFHWGDNDDQQSRTGIYEYFSPEHIPVLIIMRGSECAVYVNNDPLDYFSGCRTDAMIQTSLQAVSFHLLGKPGYSSTVTIDNVKIWDLDKPPK